MPVQRRSLVVLGAAAAGASLGWLACRYFYLPRRVATAPPCDAAAAAEGGGLVPENSFVVGAHHEIVVVSELGEAERLASRALGEVEAAVEGGTPLVVVGLDTEWTGKSTVALLQLVVSDLVLLLRMQRIVDSADGTSLDWSRSVLAKLLAHPHVVLTGSAIAGDVRLLTAQFEGLVRLDLKFVDLQHVARREGLSTRHGVGLAGLAMSVLGRHLSKDPAIRCGNWGRDELLPQQIQYAAADAVVGRDILLRVYENKVRAGPSEARLTLADFVAPMVGERAKRRSGRASGGPGLKSGGGGGGGKKTSKKKRDEQRARGLTLARLVARHYGAEAAFSAATLPYRDSRDSQFAASFAKEPAALVMLSDPAAFPGVAVRASSHDSNFRPSHCLGTPLDDGRHVFLPLSDWRACRPDTELTLNPEAVAVHRANPGDAKVGGEGKGGGEEERGGSIHGQPATWEFKVRDPKCPEVPITKSSHWAPYEDLQAQALEAAFWAQQDSVDLGIVNASGRQVDLKIELWEAIKRSRVVDQAQVTMRQRNLETNFCRAVRRRVRSPGTPCPWRAAHWLELEFPSCVSVALYGFRCTASAACHTNGPQAWTLEASVQPLTATDDPAPPAARGARQSQWTMLHTVGMSCSSHGAGGDAGGNAAPQEWSYDTATFENGKVPGETKWFDVPEGTDAAGGDATGHRFFRRFRFTFFHPDVTKVGFSVNLSGLLLFGEVVQEGEDAS